MEFPQGNATLVMTYETEIPIEQKERLRGEVDEIWEIFRADVESLNLHAGAIRAIHYKTDGIMKNGDGYGFVFIKGEDGSWHCIDDDK